MCTAIAYKGNDIIYGFNFDVDPKVWNYSLHKTKSVFAVAITVGKTSYFVHGVNKCGNFGNVPYMNGATFTVPRGAKRQRIDLMNDRYIRGNYTYDDIKKIISDKTVTCISAATMHSLIGNADGDFLIVEPGYGVKSISENFAVLTNFPVFADLSDFSNPFYGKDRYDKVLSELSSAGKEFSAKDALNILYEARQEGKWGTRVSFVYSRNENKVYYFLDGDISNTETHSFDL